MLSLSEAHKTNSSDSFHLTQFSDLATLSSQAVIAGAIEAIGIPRDTSGSWLRANSLTSSMLIAQFFCQCVSLHTCVSESGL